MVVSNHLMLHLLICIHCINHSLYIGLLVELKYYLYLFIISLYKIDYYNLIFFLYHMKIFSYLVSSINIINYTAYLTKIKLYCFCELKCAYNH